MHRIYVTPESWETPGSVRRLDEVEHWCFACCTHYPHEPRRGLTGDQVGERAGAADRQRAHEVVPASSDRHTSTTYAVS